MNETRKSITLNIEYFYKYGIYIVFALVVIVFSTLTPKFYAVDNIINIFLQTASTGISVVGIVFVIITAGIDLSVGTTILFSAIISALLITRGYGLLTVVAGAIICGAIIGTINGFVISKWKVIPFIATLATMTFGRGITLYINKTKTLYCPGDVGDFIIKTRVLGIPVIVIALIFLAIIGQLVLNKTSFGRQLFAIGNNSAAAEKIGINVSRRIFFVYLISGVFAGLSGLVSAAQIGAVTPTLGQGQEFVIISAAVLGGVSLFGGRGSIIPGALVGAILITCIEDGLVLVNANPYAYTAVRGLVIFVAVMVDCFRNKGELK